MQKDIPTSLTSTAFIISCLVALFLYISTILPPDAKADEEVLRFTTGEWPPYISEKSEGYGIIPRIVSEAFALEGYRVEYDFFPWARSYQLAKTGAWHGSLAYQPTLERTQDFLFSDAIIHNKTVLFHFDNLFLEGIGLEELRYFRIGTTRIYIYTPGLREELARLDATIIDSDNDLVNIKLLIDSRIDGFLVDLNVGNYLLQKYFKNQQSLFIASSFPQIPGTQQCIIFSKNSSSSQRLQIAFNEGLKKLKENGRFEQLLSQSNINNTIK